MVGAPLELRSAISAATFNGAAHLDFATAHTDFSDITDLGLNIMQLPEGEVIKSIALLNPELKSQEPQNSLFRW